MIAIDDKTYEVDRPLWPDFLNHRDPETHKGHYGHALLIAGSYGKMGAAVLAARAALRMGVGRLTVHVPQQGVAIMQTAVPEAMVSIDEDPHHWTHRFTPDELERYNTVGIGPGLDTQSKEELRALLSSLKGKAVVLDADALNMLAALDDRLKLLQELGTHSPTVLTPHAKEFERLFGSSSNEEERLCRQRQLSLDIECAIVYKGHRTQTTDKQGKLYINTTGNPGMATAGSGDVLTGMILAIMAQSTMDKVDAAMCAILGVWLHGKSGDLALQQQSQCSLVAGDIVEFIKQATR